MSRRIAIALGLLGLAGCATVGRQWDTTHANDLQKHAHDKAQVQSWLGAAPL